MQDPDAILQSVMTSLRNDDEIGILLAIQMGATPQEIQLLIQMADYDEESSTVTTGSSFLVRCIAVQDHRVSVGMFNRLILVDEHPVLWNYNQPFKQVYFNGHSDQADGFMLELSQLYGQHYGEARNLAQDINRMAPLGTLLSRGSGLLGEMAAPMADKVKALMEGYGYTVNLLDADQKSPEMQFKLLVMDDSFVIASMFGAEALNPDI